MNHKIIISIVVVFSTLISACTEIKKTELVAQQQTIIFDRKHWQNLADHGFPEGYLELGKIAELSTNEKHLALKHYQQAYDLGYEPAAYYLARYYYNNHQDPEAIELAKKWTIIAAKQGNTGAYLLYADIQISDKNTTKNTASALQIYRDLASHGNASASTRLAKFYEKGLHVKKDKEKALEYYRLALSQENIESELDIGRFYTYGYAVETDFNKAENIFLRFAKSNNSQAAYLLYKLYQRQFIIEKKPVLKKSYDWLNIAAYQGYIPAKLQQVNLKLAKKPNNIELIIQELKKLSNLNEGKASYQLGRLINTQNTLYPQKEELKYYQLAYQQGYEISAFRIAEYYFNHQENQQDLLDAQHWQQIAAQQNSDDSLFLQAQFMLTGSSGWQPNSVKAIEILQRLSKQGMKLASKKLAKIFEAGIHTDKDFQQALFYFERAASQGDITAKLNAADYYAKGLGTEKNWPHAEEILLHYGNAGYDKAAYLLAKNYEQQAIAVGGKIPEKAIHWYQISAKKNNSSARLKLATLKLEGQGLPQDIKKAKEELYFLSEQGIADASFLLADHYSKIDHDDIQALHFYQLAFIQGSRKPVPILAELYQQGNGIIKQSTRESYINLANTGNTNSAYLLGILDDALLKPKSALVWYKKAANSGHVEAQLAVINNYKKSGNTQAANDWLLKAVKTKNGMALLQYGKALFWGQKMKTDKIQGLAYALSASRLHVRNAVATSLLFMETLNNVVKIERANQLSKTLID
ncbi:MAG: sel1 repeat family protein [Methylococcaceae bacterium]|nr:sel1 repeat family protein [Methylococcaceae bacterium]